jgi:cell division protein FtsW
MNGRQGTMDWPLFAALLLMLGFGIVLVYSSSFALAQQKYGGADFFLIRQSARACIAFICFMVCINVDYHVWGRWSGIAYLAAAAMLAALLFLPADHVVNGHAVNGARRWLSLGPIRFQVSDFARLALIVFLARAGARNDGALKDAKVLFRYLLFVGLISGLILFEPNFSTAAVIGVIAFAILFMSGARFWHLFAVALSLVPVAVLLVLKKSYRLDRWLGFINQSETRDGIGYQVYQSLVGLGNGGLFGVGLGKGEQKLFYLPEAHTDFIFSIIGEELGFIGIIVVIAFMSFIVWRGMRVALKAPDRMGQIMAFGFTFSVALYALIHACVTSGLFPATGLPMPFLSYGGMSLIFTMSSMGIVLNISNHSRNRILQPEGGRA